MQSVPEGVVPPPPALPSTPVPGLPVGKRLARELPWGVWSLGSVVPGPQARKDRDSRKD